jgi:hypothetical protein
MSALTPEHYQRIAAVRKGITDVLKWSRTLAGRYSTHAVNLEEQIQGNLPAWKPQAFDDASTSGIGSA